MRKTRVQMMAASAVLAAVLLGGCGEAPYELTKEEEGIVVNYSAHVLAKYNKYQKDGLKYVYEQEEEPVEEAATEQIPEEPAETPDTESTTPESGAPADGTEEADPVATATLQDVFGTGGLNIQYMGARIADNYVESDVYALNANPGKTYLIMEIGISNSSGVAENLDILNSMPKFQATVNGDTTASSEITILTEDFSTYEGVIEADETVPTVLLFQIPNSVTFIDSLDMSVSVNGNDYQIILESTEI